MITQHPLPQWEKILGAAGVDLPFPEGIPMAPILRQKLKLEENTKVLGVEIPLRTESERL